MDTNTAAVVETEQNEVVSAAHKDRRYVGTKETVVYILYDIAQSFNINKYNDIFVTDIIKIGLKFQSVVSFVIGIWDMINDLFLAAIVDKTRTRWGKFKPWLVIYGIPGVALSLLFWAMPLMFGGRGSYDIGKLTFYLIFQLINNLAGSLSAIARTGMLATITPNIIDRTRLITEANLLSGFVEKAPEIIMGLLIDLVNHGKLKIKMPTLYMSGGMMTSIVSGLFALIFALIAKERVSQTVDKPSIKESFKSIFTNKPLLLITLSEFLGAFSIGSGINYYYINVLGLATMSTIVGIPGAIVSPISYSYVPWARSKFSTKTLWIFGSHISDFLMVGVFAVGSINKNYKKLGAMIPAFMLRETIWMFFWGIRSVIPEEMRNEAIDYGEWKNGYRNEGLTGVAKDLPKKLINTFGNTVKALILEKAGYVEGAGFGGQSEKTEYSLFWMCTILPVITGILSIVPKLFYDLNGEKRDKMYLELYERRKALATQQDSFNSEDNNTQQEA
ncbi:MAG: MFS transporter [Clostridia bacterium]|nr:MFS transporter [Clostridia bacterium]